MKIMPVRVLVLKAAGLLAATMLASAAPAHATPQNRECTSWNVKVSGTRLQLRDQVLLAASKDGTIESIPLSSITALELETSWRRPMRQKMRELPRKSFEDVANCGQHAGACLIMWPFYVATGEAIMLPFRNVKQAQHDVHIAWREQDREYRATYRMGRKGAESLLAVLQQRTNLRAARTQRPESDNSQRLTHFWLRFSMNVTVGQTTLMPGTYPAVFAESHPEHGWLYILMSEESKLENAIAAVPVNVSLVPEGEPAFPVLHQDQAGDLYLAVVRLGSKKLELRKLNAGNPR